VWRRLGLRASGLQARLTASYVLVTLAVVVLVEVIVLGYQTPQLMSDASLRAPVAATASSLAHQLGQQYPDGAVPSDVALGDPGERALPGQAQLAPDGQELNVPAISGPIAGHEAVTAVVVIAADGRIVASSAPSRYPPGQAAALLLPDAAMAAITQGSPKNSGSGSTPFGRVSWALFSLVDTATPGEIEADPATNIYVYVQAPQSSGFINPIAGWKELPPAAYLLLIAIAPAGALFGLLASRRMVRRVRRLERATIAVANGDCTVALPVSGRDEIGRLEENFTSMARQLDSALTAERQRAGSHARTAERNRIARELHDAISQHLFSLRMVAGGLRRANPGLEQVQMIERITEDAIGDMQALLQELRPASLAHAGLIPALEAACDAYRSRLGVEVDADLEDIAVPAHVEHALIRITQEAFTNAIRHGKAPRLAISTARHDGHVQLVVRDTGTGFDSSIPHAGSGLGHIRDRATELGGTVQIVSTPGQGAAVTVRIPVP
jgi:two-component system, NarL family, sensor histidine kinase LiaS